MIIAAGIHCDKSSDDQSRADSVSMSFERIGTADYSPFKVTVAATDSSGVKVSGLDVRITSSRGDVTPVADNGDGTYASTVTPAGTEKSGEYVITGTVESWNSAVVRTALVLKTVHPALGQPMAVPGGYVNTAGWEDSINITPDGQWLFLMYSPMSISGVFLGDPDHEWARTAAGPWNSPERPGFPDGRIDIDGNISHIFPLWCDFTEDTVVQPVTMYCFHRQGDGSFAEPVKVGSYDVTYDNPMLEFGLHAVMVNDGTARIAYSYTDPLLENGRHLLIYTADIMPGGDSVLGEYYKDGSMACPAFAKKNVRFQMVPLEPVDGADVHLFDPHLSTDAGGNITSIWVWKENTVNDELSRNIYVYTLKEGKSFPGSGSGDWDRIELPSPVNADDSVEMQPHFTGSYVYFYRNGTIARSKYNGGAYGNASSWEPVEVMIEPGAEAESVLGQTNVVGEPTLCTHGGKTYLYFVYDVVAGYDGTLPAGKRQNINFNAGLVEFR